MSDKVAEMNLNEEQATEPQPDNVAQKVNEDGTMKEPNKEPNEQHGEEQKEEETGEQKEGEKGGQKKEQKKGKKEKHQEVRNADLSSDDSDNEMKIVVGETDSDLGSVEMCRCVEDEDGLCISPPPYSDFWYVDHMAHPVGSDSDD